MEIPQLTMVGVYLFGFLVTLFMIVLLIVAFRANGYAKKIYKINFDKMQQQYLNDIPSPDDFAQVARQRQPQPPRQQVQQQYEQVRQQPRQQLQQRPQYPQYPNDDI